MQTEVVWTCLSFIRSGQNHLARHSEKGKKTMQTKKRGGKTTSGNGQAWSSLKSQRTVNDREKWRKLVVKSFVVPQLPSQLRNRWWWWWWTKKKKKNFLLENVVHILTLLCLKYSLYCYCSLLPFSDILRTQTGFEDLKSTLCKLKPHQIGKIQYYVQFCVCVCVYACVCVCVCMLIGLNMWVCLSSHHTILIRFKIVHVCGFVCVYMTGFCI